VAKTRPAGDATSLRPSIPRIDAARIDGCPEGLIFFRIVARLLAPAYAVLELLTGKNITGRRLII